MDKFFLQVLDNILGSENFVECLITEYQHSEKCPEPGVEPGISPCHRDSQAIELQTWLT